jgi:hypothetical protein
MKLLLRRDQKSGMLGKVSFSLDIRAELSEDEKANIKKYKLGETVLYQRKQIEDKSSTIMGQLSMVAQHMMNLTIYGKDLADGKRIECKDIVEMLAAESQVKEACQTFSNILKAAATFGGEEVIDVS